MSPERLMIITQHVSHAYGFRDMRSLARREPRNELVRKLKNFARNEKELIAKDRGRTSRTSDEGFLLADSNENSNDYAS